MQLFFGFGGPGRLYEVSSWFLDCLLILGVVREQPGSSVNQE